MSRRLHTSLLPVVAAAFIGSLTACGGGGGGSPSSGGSPPVVVTPPPPPPPTANHAPALGLAIPNQTGVALHAFSFDISQAGRTFTDADGDALTYAIRFGFNGVGGLRLEGTRITGIPENASFADVTVEVRDTAGNYNSTQFGILIAPNAVPALTRSLDDLLVGVNAPVNVDATNGGAAFRDADGDALTYEVSVRGGPGLVANGPRVVGALATFIAAEVAVTARDNYGGTGSATFLIAAPAAPPGAPILPLAPYIYEDDRLPIPHVLRNRLDIPGTAPTNDGAALGRVLFYDKRLSITNTVACATCHEQANGFATSNRVDTGVLGLPLRRNSMGLANSRESSGLFSDMRASNVREVAHTALTAADEMGAKVPLVESKLRDAPFYEPLFAAAFGSTEITGDKLLLALEQYVRSIISYRTRFDQVCLPMNNDPVSCSAGFTPQELRGQELFENPNIVACTSCHERWSMANIWQANNGLDDTIADPGILNLGFRRDGSQGMFRAASLRNIALTAPYMHDGRFSTLREVIDHYDHGIKNSINLDGGLRTTTGAPRRMDLPEADKAALEAFLHTLTDNEMVTDPKFSDPFR